MNPQGSSPRPSLRRTPWTPRSSKTNRQLRETRRLAPPSLHVDGLPGSSTPTAHFDNSVKPQNPLSPSLRRTSWLLLSSETPRQLRPYGPTRHVDTSVKPQGCLFSKQNAKEGRSITNRPLRRRKTQKHPEINKTLARQRQRKPVGD